MKLRKIILTAALVLPLATIPQQSVCAASSHALISLSPIESYGDTVSPQSDVILWKYKNENGKIYKRLYNSSTRTWIGDWIYVCNYPS